MPMSNECLKLLQECVNIYNEQGTADKDYQAISPLLNKLLITVNQYKKEHKDDRVVSFLSNSALVLSGNPFFAQSCRNFLISYQKVTNSLDSMLDETLEIQAELHESWGNKLEMTPSTTQSQSSFFMELQQKLAKRNERLSAQGPHLGMNK